MYETVVGGAIAGVIGGATAMVLHHGLRDHQQYRKDCRALPVSWWRVDMSDEGNYFLDRHTYHRVRFVIGRDPYEDDEEGMGYLKSLEESFDKGYGFPEGFSSGSGFCKVPDVFYFTWEGNHLFEWNIENLAQRGLLLKKEDAYYLTLDGWEWLMGRAWWKWYMLFYRSFWAYKWWALKTWARRLCKKG